MNGTCDKGFTVSITMVSDLFLPYTSKFVSTYLSNPLITFRSTDGQRVNVVRILTFCNSFENISFFIRLPYD